MTNVILHKRQQQCFESDATEILFGGAAGGGKSFTLRIIAIYYALTVPNIQIYLFRRIFSDLVKNHIEGASGFRSLLAELIESKYVRLKDDCISFSNGSKIYLCHCQYEKDVIKYQGAELNLLLIDELTHFTETIYKFLRSRVRLGSLVVPQQHKNKLPKIVAGSNPGGIGHGFVKEYFLNNSEPLIIKRMIDEQGGMLRQFIPAKLSDNPTMTLNDPLYAAKLEGLGGALARAMLDGDWNVIEGAFFDKFSTEKHVIEPFKIPRGWYRIRSFDWGYSHPFCVGWYTVSDGREFNGVYLPAGALIKYREWYGGTLGKDIGLRLENDVIAKKILELEAGEEINDSVADPAIFAENGGQSIAYQMRDNGIWFRRADNQRIPGWQQIRYRLDYADAPMLYLFKNCYATIQTLSLLQHDKSRAEDLDTNMEDHAADEMRYACMSRPLTIKAIENFERKDNVLYVQDQIKAFRQSIYESRQ